MGAGHQRLTPVDGYTHLVTGTRFWYEECADCGKRLSDDPVREEQANVVENHNIAEMDGLYCWDCGYCPNTEEELPVYSCDHTQTYERTITGNGYMPVEGTNTTSPLRISPSRRCAQTTSARRS